MDNIQDLLQKRAEKLDLGRQDELLLIQKELDRLFKGRVKADKLDHDKHVLTVIVPDSGTAGMVRLTQIKVLQAIKDLTREPIEQLRIRLS